MFSTEGIIMCAPSEVRLTRHIIIDKYAKGMIQEGLMHYQYDKIMIW